ELPPARRRHAGAAQIARVVAGHRRAGLGIARLAPAEGLGAERVLRLPDRLRVVLDTQCQRIEAGQGGQLVEEQFGAEEALRVPWRAHRPRRVGVTGDVLVLVGALALAEEVVRDRDAAAPRSVADAAEAAQVPGRDHAVRVQAGADLHQHRRPVARAGVLLEP